MEWLFKDGWQTLAWILLILALAVLCWRLYHLEQRMLYHPDTTNPMLALSQAPTLARQVRETTLTTADGVTLNAWWIAAKPGKPTVVFAHGNAGNIGDRISTIQRFIGRGYGMFIFDYRGYGKSEGVPSERGLYRDFEAASRYVAEHLNVPVTEQIALGESLGGGVVVEVASRTPFKAVFIYSTFTSVPEVAVEMRNSWLVPLPLELLSRQRFESYKKISRIQSPVLIAHGELDTMMSVAMSERLYAQVTSPRKAYLLMPGAGHNELFTTDGDAMLDALEALLADPAS